MGKFANFSWFGKIAWSPDGRWISVVGEDGQIVLIDSNDTRRQKHLGSSSGGPVS
jgi:WD40 repeat protein